MIKIIGFSLILFVCSIRICAAADQDADCHPLQLNDLLQEVILRNPNLEATRSRIKAAYEAMIRAKALDDPQVMIISDENKFHKTSDFTPMMSYEISQMFPFPGKRRLRQEIARELMLQKQNMEITTFRELIRQTKLLYNHLYTNEVSLKINSENFSLVKAMIEDSLALYSSGKGEYTDAVKLQIELQMIEEQRLMLEADKQALKSMINALLNRSPVEPLGEPLASFSKPLNISFQQAQSIALTSRSELHGMQAMVDEQKKMARLARRNYWPDFMVGLAYEKMNNNFDGHTDNAWMLKIGFNLPIWIPQKQAREARQAQANAFANLKELEGMRFMILGKLKELFAKLKSTEDKISLYKDGVLPKIKEAFFALLSSYRSGGGQFILLLDTWRQAFNADLEYERMLSEREIILAELERAMGVNLKEDYAVK